MPDVQITLTQNEAIVLLHLLYRYSDNGVLGTNDQSEQRALGNLKCLLENVLPEALHRNYRTLLTEAQSELRDPTGTNADYETENGRLAFWLEPSQIEFIFNEWRKMPRDAPEADRKQWAEIAFRGMGVLHKSGIDFKTQPLDVGYKLFPRDRDEGSDDKIEFTS